jgi:hypothetical protein
MVQVKAGVKIAWVTGGLLFASNIIGLICNRSTGKNQIINSTVYNYSDSPNQKLISYHVQQKIPDTSKIVAKDNRKKKIKSSSKYDIHDNSIKAPNKITSRKISEKEIMRDMNKYFPDKTLSVEFVAFDGADAEVTSVRNQITRILRKNGYKNIEEKFHLKMGAILPEKIVLDSNPGKHSISFAIPPANQEAN